jgi:hypothetical protein
MAIKASDLPEEMKRKILDQLHEQLGDTQYKHYIETLGEDGLLTLFLKSTEDSVHQKVKNSTSTDKSGRKPLLKQVLIWTLMIGCYLGLGWILYHLVLFLYRLLMKSLKEAENLVNMANPQYYRSKKDHYGSDKNDSTTLEFIASLSGVILNWIILRGYRRSFIVLLIIIFGLNLVGHTLYRIIKFRDKKLLVRGTVTLIVLIFVMGLFWQFFPETRLAIINYFSSSFIGTIFAK